MLGNHYRKNLRATVGASAGPYGYTLATWTTGATLINAQGIPSTFAVLAFMVGAVLGFVAVGVIPFGAATQRFEEERGQPLNVDSFFAWPLAAFLCTTAYLLVVGAESTAAYLWDHRQGS